jgi:hypothetical protein
MEKALKELRLVKHKDLLDESGKPVFPNITENRNGS